MPEEDPFAVNSIVKQQTESPGAKLLAARCEYELSQAEVAGYLNLSESVIAALENDDYSKLPGPTFVKGYLRSYARLLNLDEEEIVGNMGTAPKNRLEVPYSATTGRGQRVKIRQRRKPRMGWLILILVAGAIGWFLVANPNFRVASFFEDFELPFFGGKPEQSDEISFPKASTDDSAKPEEQGNALLQKKGQ